MLNRALFFVNLFANVNRTVESELWETMVRQSNHIDFSFSIRFQHLESAADFLGKQDDIHGETAQQHISSLSENSSIQRVSICDADGTAVFDNGDTFENVDLEYIRLALQGERSVSNPSQSLVDGVTRFFLSVPIRRGDEVVGALSGSFNIDELGTLLFADIYEGQSVVFIADQDGHVIYSGMPSDAKGLSIPRDMDAELRQSAFLNGGTAEVSDGMRQA